MRSIGVEQPRAGSYRRTAPVLSHLSMKRSAMYEDTLATVPLFHGLTRHDLQNLTGGARERTYSAGETLMAQGAPSAALFVLTEGKVRVFQKTDGGERELRTMSSGEVVGEY